MSGKPLDCLFYASDDLEVIAIEQDPNALAVRCKECGAYGPPAHSDDPKHAVSASNQRTGRMSLVKLRG